MFFIRPSGRCGPSSQMRKNTLHGTTSSSGWHCSAGERLYEQQSTTNRLVTRICRCSTSAEEKEESDSMQKTMSIGNIFFYAMLHRLLVAAFNICLARAPEFRISLHRVKNFNHRQYYVPDTTDSCYHNLHGVSEGMTLITKLRHILLLAATPTVVTSIFFLVQYQIIQPLNALKVDAGGRQILRVAVGEESGGASQVTSGNPWHTLLDKFNVPLVHGAGVKVDLGNRKLVKSSYYREPGGYCPVWGKYIELHQPSRDKNIWPNDYLVPAPFSGSPQDTKPLGGGFGLPIPKISPQTLEELKDRVRQADSLTNPHPYMMKYRRQIKDDLGHCIWWTRISPAQDNQNPNLPLDDRYRYAAVWDDVAKRCTLLYINMQELTGDKTYCTRGDSTPVLTWYCFSSKKSLAMKERVWTSPYTRMDHASVCPKHNLKHVHWGQWNGKECQRMAIRKRATVKDATECAILLFENSPSDNPTRYVGDEGRDWGQILANTPGVLLPAGGTRRDHPHSRGVGSNWANYYSKEQNPGRTQNECEIYDGVPDCLTAASEQYALVSLSSPDLADAELPPCAKSTEGVFIGGICVCPARSSKGIQKGFSCVAGTWVEDEKGCTCEKTESAFSPWYIAGPVLVVVGLAGIAVAYILARRKAMGQGQPRMVVDNEPTDHVVQPRPTQVDLLQEAEPSFWKEAADDDPTNVLFETDRMDRDF